jgi:hypothetical protein
MGSTVIRTVAWNVLEFEDFEIDPGVGYFFSTLSLSQYHPVQKQNVLSEIE